MTRLLDLLATPVRKKPALVVLVIFLMTVVFGALASQASQDQGGFEDFASDTPAAVTNDRIAELFAGDGGLAASGISQLVVHQPDGDIMSPAGVALAAELTEKILSTPEIQAVAGAPGPGAPPVLTYADPVIGAFAAQGLDPATVPDDAIDQAYGASLAQIPEAQAAQLSVLLGGTGEGADRSSGFILVFLDTEQPYEDRLAAREALAELSGSRPDGTEVYIFDFEVLGNEVNDDIERQLGQLLIVAFALIILILVVVYRSASDVIISLLGLVFTIVWMQGMGTLLGPDFLGWTGGMSQMAMAIPILLVGLGVDYGIHLTMRAREEKAHGGGPEQSAFTAIHAVGTALLLATMTTVTGFLTNLTNPLPPLQDFGVLAAVGVAGAFVVMTGWVPAARILVDRSKVRRGKAIVRGGANDQTGALGRVAAAFTPYAVNHAFVVLGVTALITAVAAYGSTQLSTEFTQTDFFPEDSRALETFEVVTEAFGSGLDETTQVLVTGDVTSPAGFGAFVAFQQGLGQLEDVRTFNGQAAADSFVSRLGQAGLIEQAMTAGPGEAIAALRAADPSLDGVLTPDGDAALLRVQTSAGEDAEALEAELTELAASTLEPAGLELGVTSDAILIGEILEELKDSQVRGLFITLIASMLILSLAFWVRQRAAMLGVMAIATVGVTALWVLGVMAAVGIPFNVMTAMVSALAIGIGVPYGIHVVNRFLEDRETAETTLEAMQVTLQHTGGALVGSAVTTVAGFGVLVLSTVTPMKQFGLVTAITIALALIANLTVLPAMLALWNRRAVKGGNGPVVLPEVEGAEVEVPAG